MNKKRFFRQCVIEFLKYSIMEGKKILIIGGNIGPDVEQFKPSKAEFRNNIRDFETDEVFDYIIFHESLNYEDNLYQTFGRLKKLMHKETKVFVMELNPLLLFALKVFNRMGLVTPKLEKNMLQLGDIENLLNIFGFDILDKGYRFIAPFKMFGLGDIINSIIPRAVLLRHLCFGQYIVFRLHTLEGRRQGLSCSVVIPCHNEEGNIKECILRVPDFGLKREIIIVNDGSADKTEDIVRKLMEDRRDIRLITYKENRGKGYAVNKGWQESEGDVLMMLDADCTTPPEELVLFHDAMENGAEFINGTRVIYPREKKSIPFLNRLGVTFFAYLISWVTQKRITDTFCGTKVFLKKHRNYFEIKEFLWGDWDLFFTAARYRMKILEMPVHYKTRKYGETKMRPIKHGLILFLRSIEGLKVIK